MNDTENTSAILSFWFEETAPELWFKKDSGFDALVKSRFEPLVKKALAGQLNHWAESVEGLLALVLLLDQMPRNIHRGLPMSFAGDRIALDFCLQGVDRGDHRIWKEPKVNFLLMPMMHSEEIAIQKRALPLFKQHCDDKTYRFAVSHYEVIARFNRFPHRNDILGRQSSDEEREFLTDPSHSY